MPRVQPKTRRLSLMSNSSVTTPVIVACDGVKLKLSCTTELLTKPFSDCIVAPFLGAFNKKRETAYAPHELERVEVDGQIVSDLSLSGVAVLGASESPSVVLHLPTAANDASSEPCAAAVDAVLRTNPESSTSEECRDALRALRLAVKEAPSAVAPALTPRVIATLAEFACLTTPTEERTWTAASAEAAVALANLLVASRDKAGQLLCAKELGALPRLVACLEAAPSLPLPRLRLLSPIVFHLSLLPAINPHADAFATAVRTALSRVASSLEVSGMVDEVVGAALASDLLRATFNLLRASPLDVSTEAGAAAIEVLVESVASLLRAEGSEASAAALSEMQLTALQLPVVLPEERVYSVLHAEWRRVFELLRPLMVAHEASAEEAAANPLVLPLLTLQKCAEADKATREALKAHIFADVVLMPKNVDPYQPAGTIGWDPNQPLGAEASSRMHLLKLLTATNHTAKHMCGNMLFAVCGEDAHEFTHLCGLGSAAGLLHERGLFAGFQQQMDAAGGA